MVKRLRFSLIMVMVFLLMAVLAVGCGSTDPATGSSQMEQESQPDSTADNILVYCGAGLRRPMEELGQLFQEETGTCVQFSFGGSAQCVSQILTVNKGDVFLPGDVAELKQLQEKNKILEQKPVVLHIPALAVPKGNPAGITGLKDLTKPGIKVVLGDPQANPIGKLADKVLKGAEIFDQVEPNIVARTATASELVTYLSMEQADAAVIWEDNLVGNDQIEVVPTSEFEKFIKTVPAALLDCSLKPEIGKKFMEFVSSPAGLNIWEKWGFKATPEAQ